jgi:hypothetical protein
MSYACSYEVPATIDMYREVRRLIGNDPALGMIAHLVIHNDSGLQHLEVWESEAACGRFREDRVVPAVHEVLKAAGFTEMPPEPVRQRLQLVDIELGSVTPDRQAAQAG